MTWFGNSAASPGSSPRWEPSWAFFRKGKLNVKIGDYLTPISWQFERVPLGDLGFAFVVCRLEAGGSRAEGQGYALGAGAAMRQAFAEAWERLWVLRAAQGLVPEIGPVTSSNGFAAGATDAAAQTAARAELIERALLLAAWRSRSGWRPTGPTGIAATLLAKVLRGHGWNLRLFRLNGGSLGAVLAGLACHGELGAVFDTVYLGDSREHSKGAAKLLRSLLRSALLIESDEGDSWTLPAFGKPEDHARFYRRSENLQAFAFLASSKSAAGILTLPNPEELRTKLLFPAGVMPAVAVASHPSWPPLTWGQQSVGWQDDDSQKGGNPWPHPLA